jgi:hypothetical protein
MNREKRLARIAGVLYLVVAVCGGFSELYVRSSVEVSGNAAATADKIAANETLFRVGALTDLVQIACFLVLGLVLYGLLEHVHAKAAVAMLVFVAVGVAVMTANMVNHFGALQAATNGDAAQAALFLDLHGYGYIADGVFLGLWLLPFGFLLVRSGAAPRALGVLAMVGAFGYVADTVANTLIATGGESVAPVVLIPSVVAELSLVVWLLVKGLDVPSRAGHAPDMTDRVPAAA